MTRRHAPRLTALTLALFVLLVAFAVSRADAGVSRCIDNSIAELVNKHIVPAGSTVGSIIANKQVPHDSVGNRWIGQGVYHSYSSSRSCKPWQKPALPPKAGKAVAIACVDANGVQAVCTLEILAGLKGEKGDRGEAGASGSAGANGAPGPAQAGCVSVPRNLGKIDPRKPKNSVMGNVDPCTGLVVGATWLSDDD